MSGQGLTVGVGGQLHGFGTGGGGAGGEIWLDCTVLPRASLATSELTVDTVFSLAAKKRTRPRRRPW
jgi:hypothetical protein